MRRRLLISAILRTRSARKKLVLGSVIVLLASAGCDKEPGFSREEPELPQRTSPERGGPSGSGPVSTKELAREQEALDRLAAEAGVEFARDPVAPGGDLRHDIESFTTLDDCARDHAIRDPLVADAVDALAYDTLVRDACRTLQALHAQDVRRCSAIIATRLRQTCEAQVAVLTGDSALCPNVATTGLQRDPVCLARARRDERLCAAASAAERDLCRALVQGRASDCGNDDTCRRQVERYRSLVEKAETHAPFAGRIHVEVETGSQDKAAVNTSFDLADLAAAGAIVRTSGDRLRVIVGTPRNALWAGTSTPSALPRLFLEIAVPTKALTSPSPEKRKANLVNEIALGPSDLTLDMLIPDIATLHGATASDRKVVVTPGAIAVGNPIHFTLTAKVSDAPHMFLVKIDVETFVRDIVDTRTKSNKAF